MDKRTFLKSLAVLAASRSVGAAALGRQTAAGAGEWAISMAVLEACSCPPFCQCFFVDDVPETEHMHHGHMVAEHACRFNQAFHVNAGHSGSVRLDGVKFWFRGNAGDSFAKPKLAWAILTFDSSASREQREALLPLLQHLHWFQPSHWESMTVDASPAPIGWTVTDKGAHMTLDGGRLAETITETAIGLQGKPVTMGNMPYLGFPRNSGFTLMPTTSLSYQYQGEEFAFKNTNGLLTTVDVNAGDFRKSG